MKQLTCEMCGSTELIKEGGVFVCQSCGCKYSVEEAKKMMVEGTVEVEGTVKVDNEDKLKNLYEIARRYKDDNNSENATKYYEQILVEDPNSWEAYFYTVYYKAMTCKIGQIGQAADSIANCLTSVFDLMKKSNMDTDEEIKVLLEIVTRLVSITNLLSQASLNHYRGIDVSIRANYTNDIANNMLNISNVLFILGDEMEKHFADDKVLCQAIVQAWENGNQYVNSAEVLLDKKLQIKEIYTKKIMDFEIEHLLDVDNWVKDTIDKLNDKKYSLVIALLDKVDVQNDDKIFWYLSKAITYNHHLKQGLLTVNEEEQELNKYDEYIELLINEINNGGNYEKYKEEIKKLLAVRDEESETLLDTAVECLDVELVKILIKLGADASHTKILRITSPNYIKSEEQVPKEIEILEILFNNGCTLPNNGNVFNQKTNSQIIAKVREKYPNAGYIQNTYAGNSSGGCYVATAVYGSYDCPEVWTLRRFRDNTLAETWYGRAFIRTYYAISPTIVKWFGDTKWFKNMWRGKLDKMVSNLRGKGVEDTPYEDRKW